MNKELLYPPFTSIRTHPKNFKEVDTSLFQKEFKKNFNATFLFNYKNCIVTHEGVVISKLRIITESLYDQSAKKEFGWKYIAKTFLYKRKVTLDEQKYLLPFNLWHGYGHWLPEVFPRLFSVKDKLSEFILLFPDNLNPQPQLLDSLAPFRFKDIYIISNEIYLKVQNLYMPQLLADTGNYNDIVMVQIRSFLTEFYKKYLKNEKQNIYLSRQKAGKRMILNEAQLIPILNKFNFKIVCAEMLSYEEQVSLFINCNCLVGMHGAGFSNMIFMQEKTKILEIQSAANKNNLCFFSLASALNIDYYYDKATPVGDPNNHNSNLIVDPVSFEKTLTEMLRNTF